MRIPTGPPASSTDTLPPPMVRQPAEVYTAPPDHTYGPAHETHPARRSFREVLTDPTTYSPAALKARWDEHRIDKATRNQDALAAGSIDERQRKRSAIGIVIGGAAVALMAYIETKHGGNRFDWFDTSLYLPDLSPVPVDRPSAATMDQWWQIGQRSLEEPNLVERLWHMDKYGMWLWDGPAFDGNGSETPVDPQAKPVTPPTQEPTQPAQPLPTPNNTNPVVPVPEKPELPQQPKLPDPNNPFPIDDAWTPRRGDTLWEQSEMLLNAANIPDNTITADMQWDVIRAIDEGNASITDPDMIYANQTYDLTEGIEAATKYRRLMSDLINRIEEDTRNGVI